MDAKDATMIARQYFDLIKKTKFFFDVTSATYDQDEKEWEIRCTVTNPFDEEPHFYLVTIDNETEEILEVDEVEAGE